MEKINYKKQLAHLYTASAKKIALVEVPQMTFLMIDGKGNPNTSSFSNAIEALYAVSYTIKFTIKHTMSIDYGVMPLEALWWADDMSAFERDDKDAWKWTTMIMQPEIITHKIINEAIAQVKEKKNPVALDLMRIQSFEEGKSAQTLHIGPFSEEKPTIEKLHKFIEHNASQLRGKHHEIYLSDTRRAAPENWKTIIRQAIS